MLALMLVLAQPPQPAGPPPAFEKLAVANGQITRTLTTYQMQVVTKTGTRTVPRDGKPVAEAYTYNETVAVPVTAMVAVGKDAKFRTAGGKELTYPAAAESLLRRPAGVVVAGGPADPAFLALLREDVVVVTVPAPAATPAPAVMPTPLPAAKTKI